MSKSGKKDQDRLDLQLLKLGLAIDLADARALIMAGQVLVNEQRIDKPGFKLDLGQNLRIKDQKRFVSRGGDKLWGAIQDLNIANLFADSWVLDCGSSTGGFTDCALQLGAQGVYALDIGFNQLAWKLRTDPRVRVMESTDIRLVTKIIDKNISVVLADLSFNSLDRLLPSICQAVRGAEVHFLLLVKPQFELAVQDVPEDGVVVDEGQRDKALSLAVKALSRAGLELLSQVESRVSGREGNREIFVLARTPQ